MDIPASMAAKIELAFKEGTVKGEDIPAETFSVPGSVDSFLFSLARPSLQIMVHGSAQALTTAGLPVGVHAHGAIVGEKLPHKDNNLTFFFRVSK